AYMLGMRAYIGHVGDSRCYLVRDGEALRLTRDQTYAQALVDQGVLLPREADSSGWGHVLANAVGGTRRDQPEVLTYRCVLQEGDQILLCTDGLTKHVPERRIPELVEGGSAKEACERLVEAALTGGGSDNVTVVIAAVVERGAAVESS
ncbi:MAG: SpoIIE family protein phosphatase, partial [Thermoanaerobaculia bacterium]|nr:SpoIIE family protein phosphatase [Thermoanaerobaculia bacterium]